jgi:cold shock CspA family protein
MAQSSVRWFKNKTSYVFTAVEGGIDASVHFGAMKDQALRAFRNVIESASRSGKAPQGTMCSRGEEILIAVACGGIVQ